MPAQGTLEAHEKLVREFYDLAFNDKKPDQAAAKYLGGTYTQHNPAVGDGPRAFGEFVTGFVKQFPGLKVTPKRWIAEGDLVAVHSHMQLAPEQRGMAVVDIFRVENGMIVEHWDVLQEISEKAANRNTMF